VQPKSGTVPGALLRELRARPRTARDHCASWRARVITVTAATMTAALCCCSFQALMVLAAHRALFLPLFHNGRFIDPMAGVDGNIRMALPSVKLRHLTAQYLIR
jgi:hypothetical protein